MRAYLIGLVTVSLAEGDIDHALRQARILNIIYRDHIKRRQPPVAHVYFQALHHCRQYSRTLREVPKLEPIASHHLNHLVGVAHLYSEQPEIAAAFLSQAIEIHPHSHPDYRMLGRAYLMMGEFSKAASLFKKSAEYAPNTVMSHQNYAARYDINAYRPQEWELRRAGTLMIYDNLGQLAEDYFLLGHFETSFRLYGDMLDFQRRFRRIQPLPSSIRARLERDYAHFDPALPTRILPYEWVTQFGHIGLLDIHARMVRLGMLPPANFVLLAPRDKVVNQQFLALFEKLFVIVRDPSLINDLFPWQRLLGDNFIAFPAPQGGAEPWTRAGARAQIAWTKAKKGALIAINDEQYRRGMAALIRLGVPEGARVVGFHVRESGYYGESDGSMSTHRNASIEDYFAAMRAAVERGTIVIRLGDASMRPLPSMEGVIDYARSDEKSNEMDIFLLANCHFIVGTTSGLTTAALALGTPMLLVNCISNDWQMWSGNTDFILKRVRHMDSGRDIPLAETYRQPMQGWLIDQLLLRRKGYEILPNTPQEIEDAVRYKLDLMEGMERPTHDTLMKRYRDAMQENPMIFGAAHPCLPFLSRHSHLVEKAKQAHPGPNATA